MSFPSAFNNRIVITLPDGFSDYWGNSQIADLIEDNSLILPVFHDDYSVITEGKGISRIRGFKNTFAEKECKYIGFRARIRDNREDLRIAIEELAEYTAGEDCKELRAIEILDYHYRKDRTDRDRGYRLRSGHFEGEISGILGSLTQGYINCNKETVVKGNRYSSGFTFKFIETKPVSYF